jgi:hypothetical protein
LRHHFGFASAQLKAAIEHVSASFQQTIDRAFEKTGFSVAPLAETFERFEAEGVAPDGPRVAAGAESYRVEASAFRAELDCFRGPEILTVVSRDAAEA